MVWLIPKTPDNYVNTGTDRRNPLERCLFPRSNWAVPYGLAAFSQGFGWLLKGLGFQHFLNATCLGVSQSTCTSVEAWLHAIFVGTIPRPSCFFLLGATVLLLRGMRVVGVPIAQCWISQWSWYCQTHEQSLGLEHRAGVAYSSR